MLSVAMGCWRVCWPHSLAQVWKKKFFDCLGTLSQFVLARWIAGQHRCPKAATLDERRHIPRQLISLRRVNEAGLRHLVKKTV